MMNALLSRAVSGLHPGAFSFVMATGILALAALQHGMGRVSSSLFLVSELAYAGLAVVLVLRILIRPRDVLADMTSSSRAPGLFTITAATSILGSQLLLFSRAASAGTALWVAGLLLWTVLSYCFFASAVVRRPKGAVEHGLTGEWLIYVVGTQSVAITSVLLSRQAASMTDGLLFAALFFHLIGIALYCALIVMIARRMFFVDLPPEGLVPAYWINMGAAAISTLAGAELVLHAGPLALLHTLLPVLTWTTLLFWAVSTWWVPLLVLLNLWRYALRRVPIAYDVQHWSMVFPLGMYAACTWETGRVTGSPVLATVSLVVTYIGLLSWAIVFWGMAVSAARKILKEQ